MASHPIQKQSVWRRYGYGWVTLGFFLISLVGHWLFGWFAYVDAQLQHGAPVEVWGYTVEMMRDTLENWQSEFLQLIWQIGGLAFLLYVGSPQSKEGDDRIEAKIDAILAAVDPGKADQLIEEIDREYAGRHTDPRWERLAREGRAKSA
ncbi:DUF6766 family protein [Ancylobacter oerskovii]|uniref:DUF6766 family protein n=1 Tax=Ancylobacter oerskovii TaxID=459519 RepID=A0ABW4Z2B2_9HYPH|nr:DUF6766 family protein [Ancylobacter oerskovii]MBS7544747.1 hypothetical protein [Ancylobacter oerskovii]